MRDGDVPLIPLHRAALNGSTASSRQLLEQHRYARRWIADTVGGRGLGAEGATASTCPEPRGACPMPSHCPCLLYAPVVALHTQNAVLESLTTWMPCPSA